MKIAFVANTCWNIFNFRKGLVQHFLSRGDEVIVLAPRDDYSARIEEWGVTWIETPLDGTGVNPVKDLKYLRKVLGAFRKWKPDVALSFTIKSNIYSCLAGAVSGVSVICNVSGLGTVFLTEGLAGKVAMILYRIAFRFARFIFFQNEDDKELFTSKIRIDEERIGVLPGSGINLKEFDYSEPSLSRPTRFLMISRLIIEKGVREYAEAASRFADDASVSFSLVGRLDEEHSRTIARAELDDWMANNWIEYHPHSDNIREMIRDAEVIVLPSYREGTPRTLLEGAAIGRALLTTDVPGCREVVHDGYNGFLFEIMNGKSLADKIRLYLSMTQEERLIMSRNSRKLVEERYDENRVIDAYVKEVHRIGAVI